MKQLLIVAVLASFAFAVTDVKVPTVSDTFSAPVISTESEPEPDTDIETEHGMEENVNRAVILRHFSE